MRFFKITLFWITIVLIFGACAGSRQSTSASARAAYSMPAMGYHPNMNKKAKRKAKKKFKPEKQKRERNTNEDAAKHRRRSLHF